MKDEFLKFISESQQVPKQLYEETKELILVSLNPMNTIIKFFLLQLLGMLLTLFICPQYGIRSIGYNGISEWVMGQGTVVCATFCSFVFFTGGISFAYVFLKKHQLKWILDHKISLIIPFHSIIFLFMMLTKSMIIDEHTSLHGSSYDITWIVTSFGVAFAITELMKLKVAKIELAN